MKSAYVFIALLLVMLVIPAMAAEKKVDAIGTSDVIQVSNITGETIIRDTQTKIETVIASTKTGIKANKFSDFFKVSNETKIAVFHSWADNLVVGTPTGSNVFTKDVKNGDIKLLKDHARFPTISPNGKYIVYEYSKNYDTDLPGIYIYNTETKKETLIAYTSGGNKYGWKTQVFQVTNDTVWYETSYPYQDNPGGFLKRFYAIPQEKKIIVGEKL